MTHQPRGPVELLGEITEIHETAKLFGLDSFTAWRLLALSVIDEKRGRMPTVMLSQEQFLKLTQRAAHAAIKDLTTTNMDLAYQPSTLHTSSLEIEDPAEPVRSKVIETVLDYSATTQTYESI